jgi:hypothetical protein
MNLEEAVIRCQSEKFNYPEIFDVSSGLYEVPELDVAGIPSWNRNNPKALRKAILEISTFRGISSEAIHYYGKIVVDGVYTATLSDIKISKGISFEQEEIHPLFNYNYVLEISKYLTSIEIEKDPNRWKDYYDEGDLVRGYEKIDELISDAKEILSLRFTGDWVFFVQYPKGNREKLDVIGQNNFTTIKK